MLEAGSSLGSVIAKSRPLLSSDVELFPSKCYLLNVEALGLAWPMVNQVVLGFFSD